MEIYKKCQFDAAHRLLSHSGKCKNMHGHTWTVEIWIAGDRNEHGMVEDFNTIEKYIEDKYDHRAILNESDPFVIAMQYAHVAVTAIKGDPTVENLADLIRLELNATRVMVWESSTAYAEAKA